MILRPDPLPNDYYKQLSKQITDLPKHPLWGPYLTTPWKLSNPVRVAAGVTSSVPNEFDIFFCPICGGRKYTQHITKKKSRMTEEHRPSECTCNGCTARFENPVMFTYANGENIQLASRVLNEELKAREVPAKQES
ncbi:MAG: hypothetical protein HGA67_02045 [Candidatus Yonathbacteria bacterium]|nr:hypothetical protein [Candidatus Yonathbacteria bacterium]